jgi:DNA-binding transcriptional ArsR family regulator
MLIFGRIMPRYRGEDLSEDAYSMLGERFKALSEPMRLRLIYALMDRERTVSELVGELGGSQSNISRHLGVLLDAGLVVRRKQGLNSCYGIADLTVFEVCDLVCGSIQERLQADLSSFFRPS